MVTDCGPDLAANAAVVGFERNLARGPTSWWGALVSVALFAIGLGFIRLFVSHFTIWRMIGRSRRLEDPAVVELLETVQAQLGCNCRIRLYETSETPAAFTVGWLTPRICLTSGWRAWQTRDLQATLAHEVAHVANGDFLQRVIAQLSAALNFYNPMVHYLCKQLCLDQEFDADARAAEVVGGRKNYLNTLASLALQNDYSKHRLAPMFLPTRKSFFRRIEMLRSKQTNRSETVIGKRISVTMVVAVAVCVAGFRFSDPTVASPSTPVAAVDDSRANLRYVPGDSQAVIVIRPARMIEGRSGSRSV